MDEKLAGSILELRRTAGLADRTVIYTAKDLFSDPKIRPVGTTIEGKMTDEFRKFVWHPDRPEYNEPDYVLVTALKPWFVCEAIRRGVVLSPQTAWINFGYCRDECTFDLEMEWRFDTKGKINLFHQYPLDAQPLYQIVKTGDVYF